MNEETKKSIFETLSKVDVSSHIEKKKVNNTELSYLSWAWGWSLVKSIYPKANYNVRFFDGKPYFFDEKLGYMIFTSVQIEDETQEMYLPVMDGANKAMLSEPYSYKVKEMKWDNNERRKIWTGNYDTKNVEKATMFDVNTAIQRCLAKNLAMFGLGISLYVGEDISALFGDDTESTESIDDKIESMFQELQDKRIIHSSEVEPINQMILEANNKKKKDSLVAFLASRLKEPTIDVKLQGLRASAEKGLIALKYDSTHRQRSIEKHLGTSTLEACNDFGLLNKYVSHLRETYASKSKPNTKPTEETKGAKNE